MARSKIKIASGIILLIIGISVFCFPFMAQFINHKKDEKVINDYLFIIETENDKYDLEKLYQKLLTANKQLFLNKQNNLVDPFSYEKNNIQLENYGLIDNIIGILDIPKLKVKLPIYLGANQQNMAKGAVHLTETSYPIGGENTNSVIAAHRNSWSRVLFQNIDRLEIGDLIHITNFKEGLTYQVREVTIINPTDIEKILIQEGKDMITLFSCNPRNGDTERYVIYAERI